MAVLERDSQEELEDVQLQQEHADQHRVRDGAVQLVLLGGVAQDQHRPRHHAHPAVGPCLEVKAANPRVQFHACSQGTAPSSGGVQAGPSTACNGSNVGKHFAGKQTAENVYGTPIEVENDATSAARVGAGGRKVSLQVVSFQVSANACRMAVT